MKRASLLLRQIGWEQKAYWRNPPAAVFTFAFPVIFLVVFSAINSDSRVGPPGQEVKFTQYYVPAIAAFGVISACYTSLAFTMAIRRDTGLLKRKRGTPLSAATYLGGLIGNSLVNAAILVVVTLLAGKVLYGIEFPDLASRWPILVVTVALGAACFAAVGVLVSTIVPNQDSAPAIINVLLFPILFISGTFGEVDEGSFLDRLASVFPIRHFNLALIDTMDPFAAGDWPWARLGVLALWGVLAGVVATRRFSWEPPTGAGRSRRARRSRG